MKLICSQDELNTALQLVSRAVASRPTHPVLANVLLTADAGTNRLSVTGFDLNLGIQTSFTAAIDESGAITLPARLLGEIVSRLSNNSPISLISSQDSEDVIDLKSESGSYQMRGMSADEFPDLPLVQSGTSLKVNPTCLLQAIRSTLFASSSDDAKQLLTGVHFIFEENNMEAAATDGHRLAVLELTNALESEVIASSEDNMDSKNFSVTLPSRSLREVDKLISYWKDDNPVSLFFDQGQVVILAVDQIITTRTLEGVYPNYSQLIPNDFSKSIILDRRSFIASLERIAVLADQHNNVVKISLENGSDQLTISADAQDVGSGSESLAVQFKGDSLQIAFNVRYLLDGLKAIDSEQIMIQCNASTSPAIISSNNNINGFKYLIMPVQIRS